MERVMLGMSGGVDSTAAALLLQEAGYDVCGATLLLHRSGEEGCGAAGRAAARELPFGSNLRAGENYRRAVAAVLVRRAAQACEEGGREA